MYNKHWDKARNIYFGWRVKTREAERQKCAWMFVVSQKLHRFQTFQKIEFIKKRNCFDSLTKKVGNATEERWDPVGNSESDCFYWTTWVSVKARRISSRLQPAKCITLKAWGSERRTIKHHKPFKKLFPTGGGRTSKAHSTGYSSRSSFNERSKQVPVWKLPI